MRRDLENENKKLQDENEMLKEAIKNWPDREYDEALRSGCDPSSAYHCFFQEMVKWQEQALKGGE
jgi:hypothetical protein